VKRPTRAGGVAFFDFLNMFDIYSLVTADRFDFVLRDSYVLLVVLKIGI